MLRMQSRVLVLLTMTLGFASTHTCLAQRASRRYTAGTWQLVRAIGGIESDLMQPGLLAAASDALIVYDYGDASVKAFAFDGSMRWSSGRRGSGPNEFRNPTGLGVDLDGSIWVIDQPNQRLTILDPNGHFRSVSRIPSGVVRCAPWKGSCLALTNSPGEFLVKIDSTGAATFRIPEPQLLRGAHPFTREAYVAAADDGRTVVAFLYSDHWFVVHADRPGPLVDEHVGVQPVQLAKVLAVKVGPYQATRIDTAAIEAVRSLVVSGRRVHILFGGRDNDPKQTVDSYDLVSGQYLGTLRLPEPVQRFTLTPTGDFVGLVADPFPALKIWRWRPR